MMTKLQVFVLVRVTVNTPLVRASLVRITRTGSSTRTCVNVNVALLFVSFMYSRLHNDRSEASWSIFDSVSCVRVLMSVLTE